MPSWEVLARRANGTIAGFVTGWNSIELNLAHNAVGVWTIDPPPELLPVGWPAPGCGAVFIRDGKVIASGMVDNETFTWSSDPGATDVGYGRYPLTGDTDLGRVAYHIVYPSPDSPWGPSQGRYYTEVPATPETRLRVLVSRQAGPGTALTARRVPGLTIAPSQGIPGSDYSIRERFTPLLDAARKVADFGDLAFDIRDQLDGTMQFVVWRPRDLSDDVRFGLELGNVTALQAQRIAPTANVALVAGGGQLDARSLHEYVDASANDAYGRREVFLDQRQVGSDADIAAPDEAQQKEYDKAGAEALKEGREQTAVSATFIDTPLIQWGRDYGLGDKVAVQTPWGAVTDLITGIDISVDAGGVETITSTIGTTTAAADDPQRKTNRNMLRRISQLERGL